MKNKRLQTKKHFGHAKRGLLVKGQWKAVDLYSSIQEEAEGEVVCFEELTDYSLIDPKKAMCIGPQETNRRKRKRKRKASETEDELSEFEQDVAELPSDDEDVEIEFAERSSKKKKKKSRKAKTKTKENEAGRPESSEAFPDEGVEEMQLDSEQLNVTAEPTLKTKKKKKKKKKKQKVSDQTQTDLQTEADKEVKIQSKKKAKNWTVGALSNSADQETDVSAWKDLFVPEPVLKALSKLGFSAPTPIQALALPPAIRDRLDVLGAAETGSGKTLSFGIPMIHSILERRRIINCKDEGADGKSDSMPQVESIYLPAVSNINDDKVDDENEASTENSTEVTDHVECQDEQEEDDCSNSSNLDNGDGVLECVEEVKQSMDVGIMNDEKEEPNRQPLLGLVLTPTRELAVQVKHHIDAVAQFTDIRTALLVGGMAPQKQVRMLKRRPEIVIATPGRLWEMIQEQHPHLQSLRQLRCLVIDEADRMVEKGHFAELENLLELLNTTQFNPNRQTFVFSATLTMVHSLPSRLLRKKGKKFEERSKLELLMEKVGIKGKPKVIDLTRKEATVETLTETKFHCEKDEKDYYLYYFLQQYPGRTMVFANSIDCIKRLTSLLIILDCNPLSLHANMHQKQRLKNLERFAEREHCVLLTTDVAARGLDVPDVQHVIHYQVPRTSETYVHRSGRTARAAKEGLSLLLIGPDDVINYKKISRTLGKDEDLPEFPIENKCMTTIKERVDVGRKIEKIEFHKSREKQHNSWMKQAADELDIDLDDDMLIGKGRNEETEVERQKQVKSLKKYLKHLQNQPIFQNYMKTKYPTQMGKLQLPLLPQANETAITSVTNQKNKLIQQRKKKAKQ